MPDPFRESVRTRVGGLVDFDNVRRNRGLFVGLGIAFVLLGILAILVPFFAGLITTILIGWLMVFAGLLEGYHAIRAREWAGSGWEMLSTVVQVVGGLFVVTFPIAGKLILTLLLAGYFIAEGVLKLVRAHQHRAMNTSGWLVFDGIITLALGVIMIVRWPSAALWVIGLLVGIHLISGGFSMLFIAGGARETARVRS